MDNMEESNVAYIVSGVLSKFSKVEAGYILDASSKRVNLAVLTSELLSPHEAHKFAMKISEIIRKKLGKQCEVSVRILQLSSTRTQYEFLKKGRVIFCRNNVRRILYESLIIPCCLNHYY